jgi:hypothetical protein
MTTSRKDEEKEPSTPHQNHFFPGLPQGSGPGLSYRSALLFPKIPNGLSPTPNIGRLSSSSKSVLGSCGSYISLLLGVLNGLIPSPPLNALLNGESNNPRFGVTGGPSIGIADVEGPAEVGSLEDEVDLRGVRRSSSSASPSYWILG